MPNKRDTSLKVLVEDGVLVIRIGVDQLAYAVANADAFHEYDDEKDKYFRNFAITNTAKFAEDVAIAMEAEKEDGSTPLSDFLDQMAQNAIDDGSPGIKYDQRIEHGKKARGEKF